LNNLYQLKPEITKEKILDSLNQEDIYEHYGLKVVLGQLVRSPFRSDEYPTCSFKWIGDMLFFRDWAEERPITCFHVVMHHYNCSFQNALEYIYRDMIEGKEGAKERFLSTDNKQKPRRKSKQDKSLIQVEVGSWQKEPVRYLKSYHLTSEQIDKFNIFPINKVWVQGKLNWQYSPYDPAIGYYFGKDERGNQKWKIYFYTRKQYRFIGNTNRINGWIQIPKSGETLIITKSLKDVACFDIFGVPAIAMQNETTIPYDYIIDELNSRFNRLISFYDFDRTGVINANKLKKLYNIPYIFLTNGRLGSIDYGAKDFSDYLKLKGKNDAKQFLEQFLAKL